MSEQQFHAEVMAELEQAEDARWQPVFDALRSEGIKHRWMPRYPDYLVTVDGRIYSGRKLRIKRMTGRVSKKGYLCVTLFNECGGKHFPIHRVVAFAFLGDPHNPGLHVNHKDGNKLNNAASNLEWCTNAENMRHSRAMGLHRMTDEQRAIFKKASLGRRQLQSQEAAEILLAYTGARGQQRVLASKYGVDYRVVWKLVNGMTYKDVQEAL